MDLDSLLADLDLTAAQSIPPPAAPAPKPAASAPVSSVPARQAPVSSTATGTATTTLHLDDLDSLMNDLNITPSAPAKAAPSSIAAPTSTKPASVPGVGDLDDLVNSLEFTASKASKPVVAPYAQRAPPAAQPPAPNHGSTVDELDSIIGQLDMVAPPAQQPAPPRSDFTQPPIAARPAASAQLAPIGAPPPGFPTSQPQPPRGPSERDELDSLMTNLTQNMSQINNPSSVSVRGVCARCNQPITGEVIQAMGKTWHPEHFTCTSCRQPLGTASFYESDGQPTCANCWKTLFCPRCAHCDQPITDRCVTALSKKWHPEHFMCSQCLQPLASGFLERDGHAFCERCFYAAFSFKCAGCGQPIRGEFINAMGEKWHPDHFSCFFCHKSFAGGAFFEYQGKPYCEQHYHQMTGAICAGCGQAVGTRSIDAVGKKWHPEHFVCAFCNNPLGGSSFKEHGDKAYCSPCFAKLFS